MLPPQQPVSGRARLSSQQGGEHPGEEIQLIDATSRLKKKAGKSANSHEQAG